MRHRDNHGNATMMTTRSIARQQPGEVHCNFTQDDNDDDYYNNRAIPLISVHDRRSHHPHYDSQQLSLGHGGGGGGNLEDHDDNNMANPLIPAVSPVSVHGQYRHDDLSSASSPFESLSFQAGVHNSTHLQLYKQEKDQQNFELSEIYYNHDDVYSPPSDEDDDDDDDFGHQWWLSSSPFTSPLGGSFDEHGATVASNTKTCTSVTTTTASSGDFYIGFSNARDFPHKPRQNRSSALVQGRRRTYAAKKLAALSAKQYQQQQQQQLEGAGAFGLEGIEAIMPDSPRSLTDVRLLLLTMENLPQFITPEVNKEDGTTAAITTTTTGSSISSNNQTMTMTKTSTTSPIRLRALSVCSARARAKMIVRDHSDPPTTRGEIQFKGGDTNYSSHIMANPLIATASVHGLRRHQNHHQTAADDSLQLLPSLFQDDHQQDDDEEEEEKQQQQQHEDHNYVEFAKHDFCDDDGDSPSLPDDDGDGLSVDMTMLKSSALVEVPAVQTANDADSLTWSCSDDSSTVSSNKMFEYIDIESNTHHHDEEEARQLLGLSYVNND